MSLLNMFKGEFIDIIEWLDDSPDTMVHRYERHDNEIKYGAKLVVRESQEAVFVNMGELADVFKPGTFTLETANIPILSKLQNWKHGFESPFKAEVYFVNTRQFTDLKWGTRNPIMMRDPEFGPIRLRAFGTYAIRVADASAFIRQIVGTDGRFSAGEITDQLRNMIVSRFADALGENKIPVLDLATNYNEFGEFLAGQLESSFSEYGLALTSMLIENISLPPEVEEALDKRTSMGVIGNLDQYLKYQTAQSMEKAAENPDGSASGGIGMGMGFGMASQMAQQMAQQQQQPAAAGGPPPLPTEPMFHAAIDGQAAGPFTAAQLQAKIAEGVVTSDSLVWTQGMAEWQPAGQTAPVSGWFAATPPPLPPQ